MIDINKKNEIVNVIREFLNVMGFNSELEFEDNNCDGIYINIKTDNPSLLIGAKGEHLRALEHLVKLMVKNRKYMFPILVLDVNNYRRERESFLKKLANNTGEKVCATKKPIALKPMSSYERRIIHVKLASMSGVVTESVGEGLERRVVIKPYP